MRRIPPICIATILHGLAIAHGGSLLVCVNDQTVSYEKNDLAFLENQAPGSVTVLDMASFPPASRTIAHVPASVIGPPTSAAKVPGKPLALVTNAMRAEKIDGAWRHVPDNRITLLRLDAGKSSPVAAQTKAGLQPSGLCVSADGAAAYVCNRAEGTLSVLEIGDNTLRERTRLELCKPEDSLAHIELSPDGRRAIATLNQTNTLLILSLDEKGVPRIAQRLKGGDGPYAVRFTPDGSQAIVGNIRSNTLTVLDMGETARIAQEIPAGRIPEGVDISPDGKWVAAACFEGANLTDKAHPQYGQPARIHLFHKTNGAFEAAGTLAVEGGPQFALFSPDGKYLVVSNTGLKQLAFYQFRDGQPKDTGYRLPVNGEPIAVAR